jgi:DNA-binding MarR family transcriptional regulator
VYVTLSDVYTSTNSGSVPCVCTTVKKLSRILGRVYDHALERSNMTITQLAILRCISRRAGEPLSRVAEELEMDRTSLYRAISPMIRDGWLATANGVDARSRTALVSAKGKRLLTQAGDSWDSVQDEIIGAFGKERWAKLVQELYQLADCVESRDTEGLATLAGTAK